MKRAPYTIHTVGMLLSASLFASPLPSRADDGNCLKIEIVRYSGRPHPTSYVCDEAQKRRILDALPTTAMDSGAPPVLQSTSAYQGMILTIPGNDSIPERRIHAWKGVVRGNRSNHGDSGRAFERMLLREVGTRGDFAFGGSPRPIRGMTDTLEQRIDRPELQHGKER